MHRILTVFVILCLNIPSLGAQILPLENEIQSSRAAETVTETHPLASSIEPWHGNRRILTVVNDYRLEQDKAVTTVVIVAGNADIYGTVTGNMLVIGGDVKLAREAQINGTLHVIGGQLIDARRVDENRTGGGSSRNITDNLYVHNGWRMLPAATRLLINPHTTWGISKQHALWVTIGEFVIFTFIYLLLAFSFTKQLNEMEKRMSQSPFQTILFGVLMLMLIPLLSGVLILSIVGVPFVLLGLALLFPIAIYGKTAIFLLIGSTLLSGRLKPFSVVFGYVLYFMAISVPYIDWGTFLAVNAISIGICVRNGFIAKPPRRLLRNTYHSNV